MLNKFVVKNVKTSATNDRRVVHAGLLLYRQYKTTETIDKTNCHKKTNVEKNTDIIFVSPVYNCIFGQ